MVKSIKTIFKTLKLISCPELIMYSRCNPPKKHIFHYFRYQNSFSGSHKFMKNIKTNL